MSISSVSVISERIRTAREHSPISVVKIKRRTATIYNAFFSSTAFSNNISEEGYIGSFYGNTGVAEFKSRIKSDYQQA